MFEYTDVEQVDLSALEGVVFDHVLLGANEDNNDALLWKASDGRVFELSHSQDCCESVAIATIEGDIGNLVGVPILSAAETGCLQDRTEDDSFTITEHTFNTVNGSVYIRWIGKSNGYYSEYVRLYQYAPSAEYEFYPDEPRFKSRFTA